MHKAGDIGFAIVVVAGLFVLTRPGSQGPGIIGAIGNAFAGAVGAATGSGGGYRSKSGGGHTVVIGGKGRKH